ncbi:hypothetical protein OSB04_010642 [Centaurea solstitialis]|uniref:Uncharacterized protein n=1 Tax=Centaurea solstitialis TaxID=347529 RepID=A0AA38TSR6_9ASTR|nr:hypothetical protein OSB04_010642 [Centaurea solstitialis]
MDPFNDDEFDLTERGTPTFAPIYLNMCGILCLIISCIASTGVTLKYLITLDVRSLVNNLCEYLVFNRIQAYLQTTICSTLDHLTRQECLCQKIFEIKGHPLHKGLTFERPLLKDIRKTTFGRSHSKDHIRKVSSERHSEDHIRMTHSEHHIRKATSGRQHSEGHIQKATSERHSEDHIRKATFGRHIRKDNVSILALFLLANLLTSPGYGIPSEANTNINCVKTYLGFCIKLLCNAMCKREWDRASTGTCRNPFTCICTKPC